MTLNKTLPAVVALSLFAAACAGGPPHDGPGGERRGPAPGGGAAARPMLFISPAGEPFRGAQGRQAWLLRVDPSSSGTITVEALVADARRYFAVLDLNHDGAIAGPEVTAYENTVVPEILGGGPGAGLGGGRQGAGRFGLLNDAQPIRSADFNLDYRVILAEYERKAREAFARLDANHDSVLQVSELPPPPSLEAPRRGVRRPSGPPGGGRGGPHGGGMPR